MLPQGKLIKMSLIDEPDVAMRVSIDDDKLRQLAESIRETGLINPIAVVAQGGRYKIYAGHRRWLAHKMLGRYEIEARDYTGVDIPPEQIKGHENLFQDKPHDGEIVVWLGDLQEKYNYPLDKLQAITGKSENWLSDRLGLYRGDRAVFDALLAGQIKIGHALELNRFPDEYRTMYLLQTIQSTPPVRLVEQWRRDVALIVMQPIQPTAPGAPVEATQLPGAVSIDPCVLCGEGHSSWTIIIVRVHKGCLQTVIDALHAGG